MKPGFPFKMIDLFAPAIFLSSLSEGAAKTSRYFTPLISIEKR
jgi:hypothetical protein